MANWFVGRHPGALAWIRRQELPVDHVVTHLAVNMPQPGDTVVGTLPIDKVAALNARGVRYFHLVLDLPPELRGRELDAETLDGLGAQLRCFQASECPGEAVDS